MIEQFQFEEAQRGHFVIATLGDGQQFSGFAAQDPQNPTLLRLDGLAVTENGSLARFSLRLESETIENLQLLLTSPTFLDQNGREIGMDGAFWPQSDALDADS